MRDLHSDEHDSSREPLEEIEALRTEIHRLTQLGASDRARSDATWAARLSAEQAACAAQCEGLAAEHQTWYARFVRMHDETCANLVAERTVADHALLAAQEALAAAQEALRAGQEAHAATQADLATTAAENAVLRHQLEAAGRDSFALRRVLQSRSWRATLPLRRLADWMRGRSAGA